MKRCIYLFLCLTVVCNFSLQAQIAQYPVQVNTTVTQATPYVPEYYSGTFPRLRVTVNNLDYQSSTLQVVVRMRISSSTFSLYTPDYMRVFFTVLDAGSPLVLNGEDLAVFFREGNYQCSRPGDFLRTKLLPDDIYDFHFEVFDAATGRRLSSPTFGRARVIVRLGEPPKLNFPENKKPIIETAIPNIMFSWRPALNLPAGYNSAEYEFTLVEIHDKQVNPEGAFDYSRRLITETVRASAFVYNAAYPQLIPGLRYAWRVRAVSKSGLDEVPVIKNNGCSEIFWFDYAADCRPVQFCSAVYENRQVNISWVGVPNVDAYNVQYRKKGQTRWYDGTIKGEVCPIYNLQFGQEYEYRIGSRCIGNSGFVYTDAKAFQLPSEEESRNVNCGIMPDVNLSNQTPARQLIPGFPVFAGDFPVFITKVSGSGTFSGEGYVGIPYLDNLQVAVTFSNIVVNTDNQLINGYFETKYDPYNSMIVDVDQVLTGGKNVGEIKTGDAQTDIQADYVINPGQNAEVKEQDGQYVVTVKDDKGQSHEITTDNLPVTIEDALGNIYEIDKEGTIKPISSNSNVQLNASTKNTPRPDIAEIKFSTTANTKYAVDNYNEVYAKVTEYFLKYKPTTEDMIASAKFMVPGASDEIFVEVSKSGKEFNPEKVRFITDKGKEYKGVYNGLGWTVTVLGSAADDGQNLYVVQEESKGKYATLARLNIYSYEPKSIKVKLVPVNGFTNNFTANSVSQQLNTIYNKVGISCEVEIAQSFEYEPLKTKAFNVTGSGLFSTLTDDMKALNTAYTQSTDYQDGAITLFMIENVTGADGVAGDMPRGKQFGYLFKGATTQTIAHEIGHGVFNLDHPFDRANAAKSFAKGDLADNLMEYSSGTNLVKLQWDAIHAPGLVIGLFEKDKGGMGIFKPDLSGIIYNDSLLSNNQTLYFVPWIEENVKFFAKQKDEKELKIKWKIGAESFTGDSLNFVVNDKFFGDKTRIGIEAKDAVIFGKDSLINVYIEKIDMNATAIIDSLMFLLKNTKQTLDSLRHILPEHIEENMDALSLLENKYISKGMSNELDTPPTLQEKEFEKILSQIYYLDKITAEIENFDEYVSEILKMYDDEDKRNTFIRNVQQALKTLDPFAEKELLTKQYKEMIVQRFYEQLNLLIKK